MENNAEQILESGIAQLQGSKTEAPEETPEATHAEETTETVETKEPDGSKFVQTTDKAADARIRYLARQVKASDEKNGQKDVLIDKLSERLEALENSQKTKTDSDSIKLVKSQIKEAIENGDVEKQVELTERLTDLKAEIKLQEKAPKKEVKAEENAVFDTADIAYVNELIPSRPYLQKGHKDFDKALKIAANVAASYDKKGEYADIVTIMEDTHKAMTQKAAPAVPEVLPGRDLTTGRTNVKIRLDDNQKQIARKLGITEDSLRNATSKNKTTRVSIDDL